jgi:hypothetical protein
MSFLSTRSRRRAAEEDAFFDGGFDAKFEDADPSVDYYPNPYCSVVNGELSTEC